MLFLEAHDDHHEDDHDDHGGLHRDLVATDAAMDRLGVLRLAARLGVALGAVPLIGCATSAASLTGTEGGTTGTSGETRSSAASPTKVPEETVGP